MPDTDDADTGAEAWPEDAVQADDVITETEAGPLEEEDLDIDAEGGDEVEDGAEDDAVDEDGQDDTDGDAAEEKGK